MAVSSRIAVLVRRLRRKETAAVADVRQAHRRAVDSGEWTQPIRTMTFTALGCETTGPDPARDAIRSVGAVKIRSNRIALGGRFYQVFRPGESLSPKEIALTRGLDRDGLSRATPLPGLERLLAFIGDSILVGHGAELDVQFLNAALAARAGGALQAAAIDTRLLHRWSRRSGSLPDPLPGEARLEDLVVELRLPRYLAHHAFYDALTTALAFLKLLGQFETSGAVQFRALYREAGVY
jgi:DNA polymerase-3 subunit epsilon